jgi:hypothetical protein
MGAREILEGIRCPYFPENHQRATKSFFKVQTNFPKVVPRTGSGYNLREIWKESPLTRNSLLFLK